jgi:hypothetical protein
MDSAGSFLMSLPRTPSHTKTVITISLLWSLLKSLFVHTKRNTTSTKLDGLALDIMFLQTVYRLFAFATIINQSIHQAFATSVTAVNVYGTIGIHDDSKISYYMGNFFYEGPSTFTLCASYCRKDVPKCKSFRYSYWADSAAQYCEFFDNGL